MRLLFDENVPRKLKYRFGSDFVVDTVQERGWSGLQNGSLLRAADAEYDAFLTFDRGLEYQQDLSGLSIRIVIVRAVANKYEDLLPLVPSIESVLAKLRPGTVAHVAG